MFYLLNRIFEEFTMIKEQDYEIDMYEIGRRIRDKRTQLHLTHKEIYDMCGISSGALSMIENGKRTPTISVLHKLACVLNCNIDWLITGTSPNKEILNKDEKELLDLYQALSEKDKKEIRALVDIKSDLS